MPLAPLPAPGGPGRSVRTGKRSGSIPQSILVRDPWYSSRQTFPTLSRTHSRSPNTAYVVPIRVCSALGSPLGTFWRSVSTCGRGCALLVANAWHRHPCAQPHRTSTSTSSLSASGTLGMFSPKRSMPEPMVFASMDVSHLVPLPLGASVVSAPTNGPESPDSFATTSETFGMSFPKAF